MKEKGKRLGENWAVHLLPKILFLTGNLLMHAVRDKTEFQLFVTLQIFFRIKAMIKILNFEMINRILSRCIWTKQTWALTDLKAPSNSFWLKLWVLLIRLTTFKTTGSTDYGNLSQSTNQTGLIKDCTKYFKQMSWEWDVLKIQKQSV